MEISQWMNPSLICILPIARSGVSLLRPPIPGSSVFLSPHTCGRGDQGPDTPLAPAAPGCRDAGRTRAVPWPRLVSSPSCPCGARSSEGPILPPHRTPPNAGPSHTQDLALNCPHFSRPFPRANQHTLIKTGDNWHYHLESASKLSRVSSNRRVPAAPEGAEAMQQHPRARRCGEQSRS